jgi:AbrB family looped-hinge helix DNA binding protein
MIIAKLGERFQVVIPKSVREGLSLKAGDRLEIQVVDGKVIMTPQLSYTDQLFGKYQEVWSDTDAVEYVRNVRESWRD